MSEFSTPGTTIGFMIDDVGGEGGIDRAVKALAGIEHGASKAVASAMKRAISSGSMLAQKGVREEYVLSAAAFKAYTKSKRHYVTDAYGTSAEITFAGIHIPLIRFDTVVSASGAVRARVKRSSVKKTLDSAFTATVGAGHRGVFERVGRERYASGNAKIAEKFGPSVPQMLGYNEDLSQDVGDKIREKFEERIDHEILAMLNGWRS